MQMTKWQLLEFVGDVTPQKSPAGAHEVTCVAVGDSLQIILVFWFGFPEGPHWTALRHTEDVLHLLFE